MNLFVRKPVFGVNDQVAHKPGCTATEDGLRLEISDLHKKRSCTIHVVKTKALISFAVTAKLICVFVFAYARGRFSHNAAHIIGNAMFWAHKEETQTILGNRLLTSKSPPVLNVTELVFQRKQLIFSTTWETCP